MISQYTLKNLKKIMNISPSLKVSVDGDYVSAIIYVDSGDDLEVIGSIVVKKIGNIDSRPVYSVTGTSGAYPGFGSLVYQSVLMELKNIDARSLFVSDRENVTGGAEGIYKKMKESECIGFVKIPVDSVCYSHSLEVDILDTLLEKAGLNEDLEYDDYLALDGERYLLNNAYFINENQQMKILHNRLKRNHVARRLPQNKIDLIDEGKDYIGEWVSEHQDALIDEMLNGYPNLSKKGVVMLEHSM
jgi:hypothetical protein